MPKRKSYPTRNRGGAFKKKRRTVSAATSGSITRRYIAPLGMRHAVLRYANRFQLNPTPGGVPAHNLFSAVSVYDPDVLLGGLQPRGFDQYIAMYEHAWVKSATIKCYFDNNAEASGMWGGVHVRNSNSQFTKFEDIMEYGLKSGVLLGSSAGGSASTCTLKVDIGKFLGIKDLTDSLELRNSVDSGPIDPVTFHITAFPLNTGDAAPINGMCEIEYDVIFCQPKMPAQS